jgi:glycosyltransferase involved in cell wall biosynthesis
MDFPKDNSISIIMPIFNQENIISNIIKGILDNSSDNVKELILIFDACTDDSLNNVLARLVEKPEWMDVKCFINDEELYEVKCCNIGFKESKCQYSLNMQDDMLIQEKDFDKRLLKPFSVVPNLFAVSSRDAANVKIIGDRIDFYSLVGKDANSPRNLFQVRDIVNRGQILFDNEKLKELNYLDEDFAPFGQDDTEICIRAYKKGWVVGSYVINYDSPLEWGGTRKSWEISKLLEKSESKNMKRIIELHSDIIFAEKHNKDWIIE